MITRAASRPAEGGRDQVAVDQPGRAGADRRPRRPPRAGRRWPRSAGRACRRRRRARGRSCAGAPRRPPAGRVSGRRSTRSPATAGPPGTRGVRRASAPRPVMHRGRGTRHPDDDRLARRRPLGPASRRGPLRVEELLAPCTARCRGAPASAASATSRPPSPRSMTTAADTTTPPAWRAFSMAWTSDPPLVSTSLTTATGVPSSMNGPSIHCCRPCFLASLRTKKPVTRSVLGPRGGAHGADQGVGAEGQAAHRRRRGRRDVATT